MPAGELLLTAFTLGLLGSGHCIAMCGGIAAALGMRAWATPSGSGAPPLALPLQALGRLTSYGALGALAGGAGAGTLPAVSGAALLGAPLAETLRAPRTRRLAGASIIAFGFWTLLSGGALFSVASATAAASSGDDAVAMLHCRAGGDSQGPVDRRGYLIEREER